MSFSAEMRDFLKAYKTGQDINASRTDQDYKETQTDALSKKTARENDPDRLKLEDEQSRANLAKTNAGIALTNEQVKNAGVSRGYTSALTDRIRQGDQPQPNPNSVLPPTMGPAIGPPAPGSGPGLTNTMVDPTVNYAEGGAIPLPERRPRFIDFRRSDNVDDRRQEKGKPTGRSKPDFYRDDEVEEGDRQSKTPLGIAAGARSGALNYAEGGAIPDADNDAGAEPDGDADDVGPAVGSSGATDFSSRSRGGGQSQLPQGGFNGVVAPSLIHDAVKGGYTYGINAAGLRGGVRSPRQKAAAQALAQGQGGLTTEEMEAARQAVDPQGKLSDSQRNMAALGSVYQYWANKGDPEKAQRVAFQMLQHFRLASQRYAALAAHAAEQGNMDLATKAAVKAYANVPDGRDMTMSFDQQTGRILYHYVDENGKTITKGIATPQELASSAMGLAKGGFDQAILSAAGAREQGQSATGGKGAGTSKGNGAGGGATGALNNTRAIGTDLTGEIDKLKADPKMKDVKPEYWGDLQNAATHIMQQNPNMTPSEVLGSAQALMSPKNDQFQTTSADGKNTVKFGDGTSITLDDSNLEAIINKRTVARKAQMQQEDQAAEDAKKPSRWDQVAEGAKQVGRGAVGIAKTADDIITAPSRGAGKVLDAIIPQDVKEETRARGKSAVNAASEAATEFGRRVMDPDNIPGVGLYKGVRDADYPAIAGAIKTGVQSALEALSRGTSNPGAIPSTPDDQVPPAPPI